MDPGTLAITSLVAGGIGTAMNVVGQISSANARAQAANYQAQVAENNRIIAGQRAAYAQQAGEAEATRQGLKNRQTMGMVRAAEAANNVDINSGSNLDVRETQRVTGMEDVDTIRHKALLNAYGYNVQGLGFESEARLDRATADNATAALPFTVGASLLEGASSLGTKWTKFRQEGAI